MIEKRTLGINQEFFKSLKQVELTLDGIYKGIFFKTFNLCVSICNFFLIVFWVFSEVSEMNTSVNEMRTRLSSTKTKTRTLIDQTTKLQKDVKNAAAKKQIASAFIEK